MIDEERLEMLERLRAGQEALLRVVEGVTEDLASRSPGPGRWSIVQCVEHIVLGEEHMLGLMVAAQRSPEPVVNSPRERAILELGANRTRKVKAPEVAIPIGRFSTLQEALKAFRASRQRTMEFVESCQEDPRTLMMNHPVVGRVNAHETMLLIAVHSMRHTGQIQEILKA